MITLFWRIASSILWFSLRQVISTIKFFVPRILFSFKVTHTLEKECQATCESIDEMSDSRLSNAFEYRFKEKRPSTQPIARSNQFGLNDKRISTQPVNRSNMAEYSDGLFSRQSMVSSNQLEHNGRSTSTQPMGRNNPLGFNERRVITQPTARSNMPEFSDRRYNTQPTARNDLLDLNERRLSTQPMARNNLLDYNDRRLTIQPTARNDLPEFNTGRFSTQPMSRNNQLGFSNGHSVNQPILEVDQNEVDERHDHFQQNRYRSSSRYDIGESLLINDRGNFNERRESTRPVLQSDMLEINERFVDPQSNRYKINPRHGDTNSIPYGHQNEINGRRDTVPPVLQNNQYDLVKSSEAFCTNLGLNKGIDNFQSNPALGKVTEEFQTNLLNINQQSSQDLMLPNDLLWMHEGAQNSSADDMVVARVGDPALLETVRESSNELTDLTMYTEREFCTEDNVETCVKYLNQIMIEMGLPALFDMSSKSFDMISIINNSHRLTEKVHQLTKQRSEHEDRIHRIETDLSMLQRSHEMLKQTRNELEEELKLSLSNASMLMVNNNQLTLQVKAGKDEIRRLQSMLQSREVQYRHESKKKELELTKLKDRMHQMLADKTDRKNGIVISSVKLKANPKSTQSLSSGVMSDPRDQLLKENESLRLGLSDLGRELASLMAVELPPGDEVGKTDDTSACPSVNGQLQQGVYEMPYSIVEADILQNLKDTCRQVREHIRRIEQRGRSVEDSARRKKSERGLSSSAQRQRDVEMEKLMDHLERCQSVIEQQEVIIQQQQTVPGTTPMLTETRALEEDEMLAISRRYYEEAQRLFSEATGVLQKERKALEEAKYSILHKEFMQLTPFRSRASSSSGCSSSSGKTNHPAISEHLLSAIKNSIKTARRQYRLLSNESPLTPSVSAAVRSSKTPTTVDLYRVLGILNTEEKRSHGSVDRVFDSDSLDRRTILQDHQRLLNSAQHLTCSPPLRSRMHWINDDEENQENRQDMVDLDDKPANNPIKISLFKDYDVSSY